MPNNPRSPDIGHLLHEELVRVLSENPHVKDPEAFARTLEELADQQDMRWIAHLADRVAHHRRHH
jgi:hypothetical protein